MITVPGILVRQSIPHIRSNSRRALVTPSTLTPSRPHTGSHIQTCHFRGPPATQHDHHQPTEHPSLSIPWL